MPRVRSQSHDSQPGSASIRKELLALRRRVQLIENVLRPKGRKKPTVDVQRVGQSWEEDREWQRHAAIAEYYLRKWQADLRDDPDAAQRAKERRNRLNAFLIERGFEPEPEDK